MGIMTGEDEIDLREYKRNIDFRVARDLILPVLLLGSWNRGIHRVYEKRRSLSYIGGSVRTRVEFV